LNNHPAYQTFRLVQIRQENSTTNSLIFDQPLYYAQPGQFVMVWLPAIGEKPYSIFDDDPFSITVTQSALSAMPYITWQLETGFG